MLLCFCPRYICQCFVDFDVLYALVFVYLTCSAKVSLGSKVRPNILGNGFVVRILLFMVKLRDFEYSAESGVKRVDWDLLMFIMRLLHVAQFVM